ncbi:Antibiotic biosynthesis monooxygenase family protein [Coccidioides posadasii C735 delta SOWgp]|uniref:Antibiotic biosynthesis monooxygenase family protein n=1 Tax=Coccidioides posadasii (strain C735) TaxID=222929 RepID=C5PIR8_COCP7|nr:Antibiotic biosynthesis monooxygenase family protein [Coccidioides posadasii C735 delta SOWgp]EER24421.1 Antibiotic biosynthesis monooxygenase family protein [Coccidioides posadasii C735 delta SOWgp]|eukprot:XP_003066566.1 Antibiotic biosynthesis monooxygenase family protein [Coccidioides posadasii C735 delta SOWgp]
MASKEIHVVATFKAKADKIDEVAKILEQSAASIHEKEPNTLRFYVVRPKKGNELIVVEKYVLQPAGGKILWNREMKSDQDTAGRYKDAAALKAHGGTEYFKAMVAKVTPLLAAPTDLKLCSFVGGFEGRPSKL